MQLNNIKKIGLTAVILLALLQCVARIAIPAMGLTGNGPEFETEQEAWVETFVMAMFVVIGVVGLFTTYGLWRTRYWGYIGTIYLSAATIVFDLWAWMTIQPSAAMGLVLPVVFIIFLLAIRKDFSPEVRLLESARGIRN